MKIALEKKIVQISIWRTSISNDKEWQNHPFAVVVDSWILRLIIDKRRDNFTKLIVSFVWTQFGDTWRMKAPWEKTDLRETVGIYGRSKFLCEEL